MPALVTAVERGDVKVSAAAAVAGLDPGEQETLVAAGPKAVRAKAAELRRPKAPTRPPGATVGPEEAEPVPHAASAVGMTSDPTSPESFPLRGRLAKPRIFDCRVTAWRRLKQIHDELLRDFADVAADEPDREVVYDPPRLWISSTDPGPDPSTWVLCTSCDGTGVNDWGRCPSCEGEGFLTWTLDPLESPPG